MAINRNTESYEAHLDYVKGLCLSEGMSEEEWRSRLIQSNITLCALGFGGGAAVRRVALKHGFFV